MIIDKKIYFIMLFLLSFKVNAQDSSVLNLGELRTKLAKDDLPNAGAVFYYSNKCNLYNNLDASVNLYIENVSENESQLRELKVEWENAKLGNYIKYPGNEFATKALAGVVTSVCPQEIKRSFLDNLKTWSDYFESKNVEVKSYLSSVKRKKEEKYFEENKEELKSIFDAYIGCIWKNGRRFEDGVSDADTVATAMMNYCRDHMDTLESLMMKIEPERSAYEIQEIKSKVKGDLIKEILSSRAGNR